MERSQVIAVPPLSWHRFALSNITSDLGPHFVFTLPVASSFLGSIKRDLWYCYKELFTGKEINWAM